MTLKKKFIFTGFLVLLSMIGILMIGQYTVKKVETFKNMDISIGRVEIGMLTLKRNENSFFAYNDLKYRDQFENHFSDLTQRTTTLLAAIVSAGLDPILAIDTKKAFDTYRDTFFAIVSEKQNIGLHHNAGLYGALRNAVHKAELEFKTLRDDRLRADMLQLRRNEKDFMLRLDTKYVDEFSNNMDIFLLDLKESEHSQASKDKIQSLMKQYHSGFLNLVKGHQRIGLDSKEGLLGKMNSAVQEADSLLTELTTQTNDIVNEEVGSIDALIAVMASIGIILSVIVLSVLSLLGLGILRSVQELADTITKAANENDLTLRIPAKVNDEIGATSNAFNTMLDKFQNIIQQLNSASSQVTSATKEMTVVTTQTTQGIEEQQSQTEQLATAMNEMVATVREVAQNASVAAKAATEANSTCDNGKQIINTSVETINTLSESIQLAADAILRVDESSNQIGSILEIIQEIAKQTNLLALNAAIEAARAGEQGRGFAVVADEVRVLAKRTQIATQETQQAIEYLQLRSNEAVGLMNESREYVKNSVDQIESAGYTFTTIVNDVMHINDMNIQIASATEEQSSVAEEINKNVVIINQIAVQSEQGAIQTAQASSELARLALDLQSSSAQFKS